MTPDEAGAWLLDKRPGHQWDVHMLNGVLCVGLACLDGAMFYNPVGENIEQAANYTLQVAKGILA